MYHITVSTDTYELTPRLEGQNPYIDVSDKPNIRIASKQHSNLRDEIPRNVHFKVKTDESVPDMVFIASGGLSLPRLPEPVVILPNMKYKSRKAELPYVKQILEDLKIKVYEFPDEAVFEGEAETAWFDGGYLLVHGYGHRSTKQSVKLLRELIRKIYRKYGVEPPKFLSMKLLSPNFYHLDMAMLPYSQMGCIVQSGSIDNASLERLRKEIGYVTEIETTDPFALNAIVCENKIISHVQTDPHAKAMIENISGKELVEIDVSEFEKAGGATKCLCMEIYDPSLIKRRNNYRSPPVSPRQ